MTNQKFFDAIERSDEDRFPAWAKNTHIFTNKVLKTSYQTYTDGDTRWIVFRPTVTRLNWILNFVFPLYDIPYDMQDTDIRIHTGILAGYLGYLRGSLHAMFDMQKMPYNVFTGHSLGGAYARLAALDINYI
jgi:predicted lipase